MPISDCCGYELVENLNKPVCSACFEDCIIVDEEGDFWSSSDSTLINKYKTIDELIYEKYRLWYLER